MEHQRREFESPEAKLVADAAGLIAEAARRSELLEREIDPVDCIKRSDDDVAALTEEIRKQQQAALEALPPQERWFLDLKGRFEALPKLHEGIEWTEVEKALRADSESVRRLMVLDAAGHKMNVFDEEGDEFIFVSAWDKVEEVSKDHRYICYDAEGEKLARQDGHDPRGNAVSIIAGIMNVEEEEAAKFLADPEYHEQLREAIKVNGGAWLKTDAATRATGRAFVGGARGFGGNDARVPRGSGSFRAALRVLRTLYRFQPSTKHSTNFIQS